ncbi:MAG TPA: ACT domain-containing protein [Bacillota bacterium]|nr:ACT domain-containing protein [Bacillota bacterium]
MQQTLTFKVLEHHYGVAKLDSAALLPQWATGGEFVSFTRTSEELSVVCEAERIPSHVTSETQWRILKIEAVLDFALVGILAAVSTILAREAISIFVLSTFNTDYILIKEDNLVKAIAVLLQEGHQVIS